MTTNKTSKLSLNSVKSAVEKVPKTRACPWVAQWFTIPQAVVKVLQFTLSVPAMALVLAWNSNGVTIARLNKDEINYRNTLYGFVFIGALSVVYSLGLACIGLAGMRIPPIMQSVLAIIILFTWLLGAPVMSAAIEQLSHAKYIRMEGVDTLHLLVATGLGFALLVVCLIDVLLGFQSMQNNDQESKEFTQELSQSKSIMMAVHSGQSFTEAKRSKSKTATKPVDETSPLKSHEVTEDSEDQEHVPELSKAKSKSIKMSIHSGQSLTEAQQSTSSKTSQYHKVAQDN